MPITKLLPRVQQQWICALVIGLSLPTIAMAATTSKADYNAARERTSTDYKVMRAKCDGLAGNSKDVCVAEAKAAERKGKAEAEAAYKNTDKARRDARIDAADANYMVAKARCGAKAGHDRNVCMTEAKAAQTKAKVDAKAASTMAGVRKDAETTNEMPITEFRSRSAPP